VKTEHLYRDHETVFLVVIDDSDMLLTARAALSGSGRVLQAWSAATALWILRTMPVDFVLVRDGMAEQTSIELECSTRGIQFRFIDGEVDGGFVRLRMPELLSTPATSLVDEMLACVSAAPSRDRAAADAGDWRAFSAGAN
jgi:hypothetical protein